MRVGTGGSQVTGAMAAVETGEHSLTILFTDSGGKPTAVPVFSAARRTLPERMILRIHGLAENRLLNLEEAFLTQEGVSKAYALSTTDPAEQGVIFHLKPGWSCAAAQYENRLTLQFTWEVPEKPAVTGYVLSSPPMEPGTELAELTGSLLWEGATQLQLSPRDYRVVLGEFSTQKQAEMARETILKNKNIPLEVLPIFPEDP